MDLLSRPDGADNCTVCRFGDACAKFNPNVSNLLARRSHLPWLMRRPSLELDERTRSLQPRERLEYPPRVSRAGFFDETHPRWALRALQLVPESPVAAVYTVTQPRSPGRYGERSGFASTPA